MFNSSDSLPINHQQNNKQLKSDFVVRVVEEPQVPVGHDLDELLEFDLGLPTELALGLGGVAEQLIDFAGAILALVHPHNDFAGGLVLAHFADSFAFPSHIDPHVPE